MKAPLEVAEPTVSKMLALLAPRKPILMFVGERAAPVI